MPDRRLFYDTIADEYDRVMSHYELNKRIHLIFEQLLPDTLAGKRVLDMGCGTGWFTHELIKRGGEVVSSDIGHQLLLATRTKTAESSLVVNSLEALGFVDACFDIVLCTEVIEHTPNPRQAVAELMRVLKPGGVLVLTVPNRVWQFSVAVADKLGIRPYKGFENWVGWNELEQWIEQENGQLESKIGFNLFPLFYRPFYPVLDLADRYQRFHPWMVNIGVRVRK